MALPSVDTAPSSARTVPSGRTDTGRSPTAVSTTNSGVGTIPRIQASRATHRSPLPHISAAAPSAFQ